jgi:hypothetical protein
MKHCEGKNKKELLGIIETMRVDHEIRMIGWIADTLLLKAEITELKSEKDKWKEIVEPYRECFNEV